MRQAAPILDGTEWEVDDAAPTWVKSEPPPSELEATLVWREDKSGIRATELADFAEDSSPEAATRVRLAVPPSEPPRESFPEIRFVPPSSALRPALPPREPSPETTLVFPLERRLSPPQALRPVSLPPVPIRLAHSDRHRARVFATVVATFCVMAVLFALALPWVMAQVP
jgi:hypothetical protein